MPGTLAQALMYRTSALTYGVIFPTPTLKLLQVWLVLGDHVGEVWVTHEKANYCNFITTSWLLSLCWLRDWGCSQSVFLHTEYTAQKAAHSGLARVHVLKDHID